MENRTNQQAVSLIGGYSFDVDLYAKWDSAEGEQVVKKYMAPGDEWADASAIRKALEELKGRELI